MGGDIVRLQGGEWFGWFDGLDLAEGEMGHSGGFVVEGGSVAGAGRQPVPGASAEVVRQQQDVVLPAPVAQVQGHANERGSVARIDRSGDRGPGLYTGEVYGIFQTLP